MLYKIIAEASSGVEKEDHLVKAEEALKEAFDLRTTLTGTPFRLLPYLYFSYLLLPSFPSLSISLLLLSFLFIAFLDFPFFLASLSFTFSLPSSPVLHFFYSLLSALHRMLHFAQISCGLLLLIILYVHYCKLFSLSFNNIL